MKNSQPIVLVAFATIALSTVANLSPAYAGPPAQIKAIQLPDADTPGSAAEAQRLAANAPKAEEYPNAAKATLLDLSDIVVQKDGSTKNLTRETVKLFTDRARDDVGEVRIPYTQGEQTVKILFARTIRPDGTVVVVKPEEIHDLGFGDSETY